MMKRIFFAAALCILFLGFAPEASAMPGDCFSTCNVYAACGTETCQDCVWPYSDTECIQWGYAECQWYGLCGQTQPCYTVREYDTYTPAGNWQWVQRVCYRDAFRREKPVEEYTKRYLKKHYRVRNCQGVETTELVYETYVYDHCYKDIPFGGCGNFWPRTSFPYPTCPF
jgi:hypothetical protein